jgi:hypothetical protein
MTDLWDDECPKLRERQSERETKAASVIPEIKGQPDEA